MGYIFMSLLTASVAFSVGELSAFMPATGGFIRHTTKFVQPALGAAIGWNYCNLFTFPLDSLLSSAANLSGSYRVHDGSDGPCRAQRCCHTH